MADDNKKYKGLILIAILIAVAAFSSSSAISGLANFTINVSGYPGQPGIDSNVTLICEGNTTCTSDNANHSILITSTGGGGAGNGLTNQSVNPYSMNAVNLTGKIPYTSLNASLCNPANQFSVFNQNTFNFDCVASPGADDDSAYVPYTGANQNVDLGGFDINSSNSKSTTVSTNTIVPNNNNFPLEVWSPSGSYPYPPSHSFHTSYQNEGAYFVYRECDPFCTNYNKSFQNNIEYSLYEDLNMNGNNILNSPSISTFNQTYDNYQQIFGFLNNSKLNKSGDTMTGALIVPWVNDTSGNAYLKNVSVYAGKNITISKNVNGSINIDAINSSSTNFLNQTISTHLYNTVYYNGASSVRFVAISVVIGTPGVVFLWSGSNGQAGYKKIAVSNTQIATNNAFVSGMILPGNYYLINNSPSTTVTTWTEWN